MQSYPAVTDFLQSGLFRWAGDAGSFTGDTYIELVCSPNNPDGAIREAVLSSASGVAVHDLAYYWPQYTAITRRADHDIMLFTVSKSTGHAGTRIGYGRNTIRRRAGTSHGCCLAVLMMMADDVLMKRVRAGGRW